MRGLMMGGWFVATAIGNKLTAIGRLWDPWYHSSFWLLCSLLALVPRGRPAPAPPVRSSAHARRLSRADPDGGHSRYCIHEIRSERF